MSRSPRMTACVMAACSLAVMAACAGPQDTQPGGRGGPGAGCNAQAVQDLVGQYASALIAEGARQRAGAQRVRMIGHDEMVTKEYDAGRLNLQLDAQGRVARVYCG